MLPAERRKLMSPGWARAEQDTPSPALRRTPRATPLSSSQSGSSLTRRALVHGTPTPELFQGSLVAAQTPTGPKLPTVVEIELREHIGRLEQVMRRAQGKISELVEILSAKDAEILRLRHELALLRARQGAEEARRNDALYTLALSCEFTCWTELQAE